MSSCSIEAYDGDCYDGDFSSSVVRKARKQHICGECGRIIHVGEQYEYATGKHYGDFYDAKTCTDCLSLREAFFCSWLYGNIWDDFWDWLDGFWYNDSKELYKLEKLTPTARAIVLAQIDKWERREQEDEQ